MKNIYLAQPNNVVSGKVYFPYAVGTLAAYAWQFDSINKEYRLCDFIYKKDPVDFVCTKIEDPYLIGFSCYMWNVEYNLALAASIKNKWPDCIIVFGGQQVPDDTTMLKDNSFIDILIHGEGEQTFYLILDSFLSGGELDAIPNISFRDGAERIRTEKKIYRDVSEYPSPYSSGLFDRMLESGREEGLDFDAVLETNRGCPYGCIYCYWAGTETNFRVFPIERVFADIYWISKNQISFCICADSNFGILPRDQQIAEYLIACKKEFGFPKMFETAAAKNKDDVVFEIHKKLNAENLCCGISMAVQSFSPTVLENIGRKNISIENFSQQLERYRNEGMSTYTDIILGLPGETFESFCAGIFKAIEAGQHTSINIHPCEVLPNTILYLPEIRDKYKIKTVRAMNQDHAVFDPDNSTYSSRSEIIVSTNTMTEQDWSKAMRLATSVQSFHSFGLLKFIAIYLRKAKNISYEKFYMRLYDWIDKESRFVKSVSDDVFSNLDLFLSNRGSLCYYNPRFTNTYLYFREGLFLCCIEELNAFYDEISRYLVQYFDDRSIYADLLQFQKAKVIKPADPAMTIHFEYDWQNYFENVYDNSTVYPEKKPIVLQADECTDKTWKDYIYNKIWFGKRENKMVRVFRYGRT